MVWAPIPLEVLPSNIDDMNIDSLDKIRCVRSLAFSVDVLTMLDLQLRCSAIPV